MFNINPAPTELRDDIRELKNQELDDVAGAVSERDVKFGAANIVAFAASPLIYAWANGVFD